MAKRVSHKTLPVLVRLPHDLAVALDELRRRELLLESRPGAIRLILRRALSYEGAAQMGAFKKDIDAFTRSQECPQPPSEERKALAGPFAKPETAA
jgi:hypothetical protein